MKKLICMMFFACILCFSYVHGQSSEVNGKIIFTSEEGGRLGLYMMDSDGNNMELIQYEERIMGQRFNSLSCSQNGIVLVSLDGGTLMAFNVWTGVASDIESDLSNYDHGSATISPDGELIAFELRRDLQVNISHLSGEDRQQISRVEGPKSYISWSPDQRYITFVTYYDATHFLVMVDLNTQQQYILAESTTHNISYPSWSPSGDSIIYTLSSVDSANIWRANLEDNSTTMVETNDIRSVFGVWSPDEEHIIYSSRYDDGWRMTILNLETGDFRIVRNTDEREIARCWLPTVDSNQLPTADAGADQTLTAEQHRPASINHSFPYGGSVRSLNLNAENTKLFIQYMSLYVEVVDLDTGDIEWQSNTPIYDVRWHPTDSHRLLYIQYSSIYEYHFGTNQATLLYQDDIRRPVSAAYNSTGSEIAISVEEGIYPIVRTGLLIIDTSGVVIRYTELSSAYLDGSYISVQWGDTDNKIATLQGGRLQIWDASILDILFEVSYVEVDELGFQVDFISNVAWNSSGDLIALSLPISIVVLDGNTYNEVSAIQLNAYISDFQWASELEYAVLADYSTFLTIDAYSGEVVDQQDVLFNQNYNIQAFALNSLDGEIVYGGIDGFHIQPNELTINTPSTADADP